MVKTVMIGSRALKTYIPTKSTNDYDIITTEDNLQNLPVTDLVQVCDGKFVGRYKHLKCEIWIAKPGTSNQMILESESTPSDFAKDSAIPSINVLATIKRSHLYWPIHWDKSISDYHLMKQHGAVTIDSLLQKRIQETEDRVGKKKEAKLNYSNDKFFKKSAKIGRTYEHDDLHRATCYGEKPLFESLKKDTNKASVSKKMFNELPDSDKIKVAREECYAIALERVVIPRLNNNEWNVENADRKMAFKTAICKLVTRMTSGWFREFLIENHPEICLFDKDFVLDFEKARISGKIKPLD